MQTAEKWKTLGKSLLPIVMWLGIQAVVAAFYFPSVKGLSHILELLGADSAAFRYHTSQEAVYLISILMDVLVLIPGLMWLRRLQEGSGETGRRNISGKDIFRICMIGLAIQAVTDVVLEMAAIFLPGLMYGYGEVMENLGMFSPTVSSVLYTALFAPIAEELVLRGLTLRILERGFSFAGANVLQALYFALIHGNLVQGAYAFFAGLIFGRICRKYGTVKASVLCHMTVNITGLLMGRFSLGIGGLVLLSAISLVLAWDRKEKNGG